MFLIEKIEKLKKSIGRSTGPQAGIYLDDSFQRFLYYICCTSYNNSCILTKNRENAYASVETKH